MIADNAQTLTAQLSPEPAMGCVLFLLISLDQCGTPARVPKSPAQVAPSRGRDREGQHLNAWSLKK
jgi:hypothetical protein